MKLNLNLNFLHSRRLHLALVFVWLALMIPTVTIWADSVMWVGIISVYANVVSHWGAYQAARAEKAIKGEA